jgi:hypothetical protein
MPCHDFCAILAGASVSLLCVTQRILGVSFFLAKANSSLKQVRTFTLQGLIVE